MYDLAKNFQIFFKNMLLTLLYLDKTCDGEQKLFLRINLHINAHKGIETIFADWTVFCWKNVYDLAKNFQIFSKNMLLTPFYLERHVMEMEKLFCTINFHVNAHKEYRDDFC